MKRPECYGCHERPARKGSRFCSQACAAAWAELLAEGNGDEWCGECGEWVYPDQHQYVEHQAAGMQPAKGDAA